MGFDSKKLNTGMLSSQSWVFEGRAYVVLVHDGCDIRKAHAEHLEYLGWVQDLSGKWIRGYNTLNSVCVDLQGG